MLITFRQAEKQQPKHDCRLRKAIWQKKRGYTKRKGKKQGSMWYLLFALIPERWGITVCVMCAFVAVKVFPRCCFAEMTRSEVSGICNGLEVSRSPCYVVLRCNIEMGVHVERLSWYISCIIQIEYALWSTFKQCFVLFVYHFPHGLNWSHITYQE